MSSNCEIRIATRDDAPQLAQMVLGLMAHLGDALENFDSARFNEDAFGAEPQFSVFVATRGAELIGTIPYTGGWAALSEPVTLGCDPDFDHANDRRPFWGRIDEAQVWSGHHHLDVPPNARTRERESWIG